MIILLLALILACLIFGGEAILELIIWCAIWAFKIALCIAAIVLLVALVSQLK
jgi:hypothetical protein